MLDEKHTPITYSHLKPTEMSAEFIGSAKKSTQFTPQNKTHFSFSAITLLIWVFWKCQMSPAWLKVDCSQLVSRCDHYQLQLAYPTVERPQAKNLQHAVCQCVCVWVCTFRVCVYLRIHSPTGPRRCRQYEASAGGWGPAAAILRVKREQKSLSPNFGNFI